MSNSLSINQKLVAFNRATGLTSQDVLETVQFLINSERLVMFAKHGCYYCSKTIELLRTKHGVTDLIIWYINDNDYEGNIISHLFKYSGKTTVPQVYIYGRFMGDASMIKKYDTDGTLATIVKEFI